MPDRVPVFSPNTIFDDAADDARRVVDTMSDDKVENFLNEEATIDLMTTGRALKLRQEMAELRATRPSPVEVGVDIIAETATFAATEIGRAVVGGFTALAEDISNIPLDVFSAALDHPGLERRVNRYFSEGYIADLSAFYISRSNLDLDGIRDYYRQQAMTTLPEMQAAFPEQFPPTGRSSSRREVERIHLPDLVEASETPGGRVGRELIRFGAAMVPVGAALRGVSGGAALTRSGRVLEVGLAFGLVQDPAEDVLMTGILRDNPQLANSVTEFLATDEDDPMLLARIKGFYEGAAIGATFETFGAYIKGLRQAKAIQRSEGARLIRESVSPAARGAQTGLAEKTPIEQTLSAAELVKARELAGKEAVKRAGKLTTPVEVELAATSAEIEAQRLAREGGARVAEVIEPVTKRAAVALGEVTIDTRKRLTFAVTEAGDLNEVDFVVLNALDKATKARLDAIRTSFSGQGGGVTTTSREIATFARRITTPQVLQNIDPTASHATFAVTVPQLRALKLRADIIRETIPLTKARLLASENATSLEALSTVGLGELERLATLEMALVARLQRVKSFFGLGLQQIQADEAAEIARFTAREAAAQAEGFASALQRSAVLSEREAGELIVRAGGRAAVIEKLSLLEQLPTDIQQLHFWRTMSAGQKIDNIVRFSFFQSTLSGLATGKAIVGNSLFAVNLAIERAAASALEVVSPSVPFSTASPDFIVATESIAFTRGLFRAMPDSVGLFWRAFARTEFPELVRGSRLGGARQLRINPLRAAAGSLRLKGGFYERLAAGMNGLAFGAESPLRALSAVDWASGAAVSHAHISAVAHRQAVIQGLTGNAYRDFTRSFMANPPEATLKEALLFAGQTGLRQPITNPTAAAIMKAADTNLWANLAVPYLGPQFNQVALALERTPLLNLLLPGVRADLAAGGARRKMTMAKAMVGGTYITAGAGLALNGRLFGRFPQRSGFERVVGTQDIRSHTIIIPVNGKDRVFRYNPDTAVGKLLETIADVVHGGWMIDPQTQTGTEVLTSVLGLGMFIAEDQVSFDTVGRILDASNSGISTAGGTTLREIEQALAGIVIPGAVRIGAEALGDREQSKVPANFVESLDSLLGGAIAQGAVDIFANQINKDPGWWKLFPFPLEMVGTNRVATEIFNLTLTLGRTPVSLPSPTIASIKLTTEETRFYSIEAGRLAMQALEAMMDTKEYLRAPPDIRANLLSASLIPLRDEDSQAVALTIKRFPRLVQAVRDERARQAGIVSDFPRAAPNPTNLETFMTRVDRLRALFDDEAADPVPANPSAAPVVP